MCPACARPVAQCACRAAAPPAGPAAARIRVGRQTKGRKGKTVTVITGLPLGSRDLTELAASLKRKCGSGGTVREGVIEVQGDHRELIVAELAARGWEVKRSG